MAQLTRVGIVGGGVAGIAAAVALADKDLDVQLIESRDRLGGRSHLDTDNAGQEIENGCQQVSAGSDVNVTRLLARIEALKEWEAHSKLRFFSPEGVRSDLSALPGLPAPLHLAPSLLRLNFLRFRERWSVAKALLELAKPISEDDEDLSILRWLRLHDQSVHAIERFWHVLLCEALGSLEQASLAAARAYMLQRFLLHRSSYTLRIPVRNLREALVEPAERWLEKHGAKLHLQSPVRMVLGSNDRCQGVLLANGAVHSFDIVIAAVPWWSLCKMLSESLLRAVRIPQGLEHQRGVEVAIIDLWFDRPLTPLPHVFLVDGLAQQVFRRHPRASAHQQNASGFFYQVILNPARNLDGLAADELARRVQQELLKIWPASRGAALIRSRFHLISPARFPSTGDFEALRPAQVTSVPNLMLAGDWTRTGCPSSLEGAIKSGFLAAEGVLQYLGRPQKLAASEPAPEWLARRLFQI